jgi:hypothetical protein
MNAPTEPIATAPTPRGRMIFGATVFVVGQLAPLAVPLVTRSDLAPGVKATLTGLLLLGVPELAILAAVAILGKAGFDALVGGLKRRLGAFFKEHGPAQQVSPTRYRIGLVLFMMPILFGWISPYAGSHLPGYTAQPLTYAVVGDVMMVVGLFVLGGEFWDKLRSLFVHRATATFPAPSA